MPKAFRRQTGAEAPGIASVADAPAVIARLRGEIRQMQEAAERRNRDLDALHLVWCDGGCPDGVHRYGGLGPEAITAEMVAAAVRNTRRLETWWCNRQSRLARKENP